MNQCAVLVRDWTETLARITAKRIDAEEKQHHTTRQLQDKHISRIGDEIHHERHSEARKQSIYYVAQRCTETCNQAVDTAFV